jgi:hypothetical protein
LIFWENLEILIYTFLNKQIDRNAYYLFLIAFNWCFSIIEKARLFQFN